MYRVRTVRSRPGRDRPDRMVGVRAVVADCRRALQSPAGSGQVVDRRVRVTIRGQKSAGSSRRVVFSAGLGTQMFHDVVVVRFGGDFVDELGVGNFACWVGDHDGAREQTLHG